MREGKNIKNNLAYYLVDLTNLACALSVIWEMRENESHIDSKTQAAINFISRELYERNESLMNFLEDEDLTEFVSDRDIYDLLAEQKRESVKNKG
ncbi:hypothetical protein EWG90_06005 [Salmonella enterica subsp. enterica serovar Derby]|nr:hypothetical protein [Salmonella enterica subsp. enterica serovar Derby]